VQLGNEGSGDRGRRYSRDACLPHRQDACAPSILPNRFGEGDVAGFEIQLGFGGGAEDLGAVVVELAFPSGDDNGGEAVADQVYAGAEDQRSEVRGQRLGSARVVACLFRRLTKKQS
jgi:hypothetical protein